MSARLRYAGDNPLDLDNLLFMGSSVVSGTATAVVLTTGGHSYLARKTLTAA